MYFPKNYEDSLPIQSSAGRRAVERALIWTIREFTPELENGCDYDSRGFLRYSESELVEMAIENGIIEIAFDADYLRVNDIASDIMYGEEDDRGPDNLDHQIACEIID